MYLAASSIVLNSCIGFGMLTIGAACSATTGLAGSGFTSKVPCAPATV